LMFIIAKLTKASYNKKKWTEDFYSQFRYYFEHFFDTNFDENKFWNCLFIEIMSFFPEYFDYNKVFNHIYFDQVKRIKWPKSILCNDLYKKRDNVFARICWNNETWKYVFKVPLHDLYKQGKAVLFFTKEVKGNGYPSVVFNNNKESDVLNASTNQGTFTYTFTGGGAYTELKGVPSPFFEKWDKNNQPYGSDSFKLTACMYVERQGNNEELKIIVGNNAEYNINKFSNYDKDDVLCFYARAVQVYKLEIELDTNFVLLSQILELNLQDLLDLLYVGSLL